MANNPYLKSGCLAHLVFTFFQLPQDRHLQRNPELCPPVLPLAVQQAKADLLRVQGGRGRGWGGSGGASRSEAPPPGRGPGFQFVRAADRGDPAQAAQVQEARIGVQ